MQRKDRFSLWGWGWEGPHNFVGQRLASELSLENADRISTVTRERGVAFLAGKNPGTWGRDTGKY